MDGPLPLAAFYDRPVTAVARDLLGAAFTIAGVGGRVVEVEAYDHEDPASHSFGLRRTARNATMFGPPGHLYVYRSYGIHWCANIVCRPASAVLLRALAPEAGLEVMRARRGPVADALLCSGPGRLCQALGITAVHDGAALDEPPFVLRPMPVAAEMILAGPRIGITKGVETPWRFGVAGSKHLSRRFPA